MQGLLPHTRNASATVQINRRKFRELFSRHRKSPNGMWKDYYFEIRAYFEGWLNELKIDSFDGLKNLMIADKMKKRCSPEWDVYVQTQDLHIELLGKGYSRYLSIRDSFSKKTTLAMILADGKQSTGEAFTTQVMVEIEGRSVMTKFIILPKAKGNRTLLTPVPAQRFETLAIDLFGPLPESKDGKRWILIIEDCTNKWVELFALPNATAKECAITLIEEVLLRYGIPRRLISDNGTQFVSAVMQQICYLLNIHQSLDPCIPSTS
ncbi:transposon Tf2-8 polyprotein [Trichonephila clavipes]|nr:transposon Tf2-8 polyprotein [Trichonephila clavipes]